jgi:hypothetical protein
MFLRMGDTVRGQAFGLDLAPLIADKAQELLRRAGIIQDPS